MSPKSEQQIVDYINHMFEQLDIYASNMNEWEENFIASIRKQFKEKNWLSPKQREILERIYNEKT